MFCGQEQKNNQLILTGLCVTTQSSQITALYSNPSTVTNNSRHSLPGNSRRSLSNTRALASSA